MAATSSRAPQNGPMNDDFGHMHLAITGIGVEYPPHNLCADDLDTLCQRWYPESAAMAKIRAINHYTGIEYRSSVGTVDYPLANMPKPPAIDEVCKVFLTVGVALAVSAARKAIAEAGIHASDITHMVSTTCTNSANPGFDHFVLKGLGITHPIEKVLLHGVGCSGGLASLRTAANIANGASYRKRKARVLVVALEISTILVRSELDSIHETQETRIGVALFSDCASALILSNGIDGDEEPIYDLLGWDHRIIPDTEDDLGFDVDPLGWKVVLTPRVPTITCSVVQPAFTSLISLLPGLPAPYNAPTAAAEYDWALHPGGSSILSGVEKALGLTPEHMRASYDIYMNHGNSSSATILSVLDRLRHKDLDAPALNPAGRAPRDHVVGAAFGPGISVEMVVLKRHFKVHGAGLVTPPDSERNGDGSGTDEDVFDALNGLALD